MAKDYYAVLGVDKDATPEQIKKAYRKLAVKYHPDKNPDDQQAEARFKEVTEAYAVLSDPDKKRQYDQFGDTEFHQQYSQEDIFRNFDFGDIFREFGFSGGQEDIFSHLFGGRAGRRTYAGGPQQPRPVRGQNYLMRLTIPFRQAVLGGTRRVDFERDGQTEHLEVQIPPGIESGQKLRISGKGGAGHANGPAGDLLLELQVSADQRFRREGKDLLVNVKVPFSGACLGTSVEVPTLQEPKKVKIKPGTRSGSRVRLKGYGVPGRSGREPGDLYAVVEVEVPKQLDDQQREVVEQLRDSGL